MPLIHVYLNEGKDRAYKDSLSDGLHEALLETWNIPLKDRFQIFHEKKPADLQIDKEMWDVQRSDDVVVFHVFTSPRTSDMKLALYQRLPQILEKKVNLRPEDVFVSISSNTREDWSFGNGKAQLLAAQGKASPEVLAAPASIPRLGSARRPLSTLAGPRHPLATVAPRLAGPGAAGKLGFFAACGVSAFFGAVVSQSLSEKKASEM